jgi:1-acyl-sn-glycerol-3-phosphate acyltransferase
MIFTLFALTIILLSTAVLGALGILFVLLLRSERMFERIERLWVEIVLKASRVRVHVEGKENLVEGNAYIFISNHLSYYDIPVLVHSVPGSLKILTKKELFRVPIFGTAIKLGGHIRVDRFNRREAIKSVESARSVIARGKSVLVFAEGTRSVDGNIGSFKKGGIMLALKTGAPIVPVTIFGSNTILGKDSWRLHPGTVRVQLSPPFNSDNYDISERDDLLRRIRETIVESYESFRQTTD